MVYDYAVASDHTCILPYKHRKISEMLLKLMELCFNNGELYFETGGKFAIIIQLQFDSVGTVTATSSSVSRSAFFGISTNVPLCFSMALMT